MTLPRPGTRRPVLTLTLANPTATAPGALGVLVAEGLTGA
jgi:hypothetical protein